MSQSLYRNYNEQRNLARKSDDELKRASMAHLAAIRRADSIGGFADKAAHQYRLGKVLLQRGQTVDAVKRPTFYHNAEPHLDRAIAYYKTTVGSHNELADCYVILARLKIAQLELNDAEQDLNHAVTTMACSVSACPRALRDNLLAAYGELCNAHVRAGQISKAKALLSQL
jgi:tetratricopeptide (TPR) repeat protein